MIGIESKVISDFLSSLCDDNMPVNCDSYFIFCTIPRDEFRKIAQSIVQVFPCEDEVSSE